MVSKSTPVVAGDSTTLGGWTIGEQSMSFSLLRQSKSTTADDVPCLTPVSILLIVRLGADSLVLCIFDWLARHNLPL